MSGKQSWNLMAIVLGNMLYALTVELFLTPCGLITGGSTGISLFLWRLSGIPASLIALVFNAVLLVVGWLTLGKKFALTTILSTFLFPLFLGLFERLLAGVSLTDNLILNAVFSGLGIGAALALVLRAGASTGGMDIPPLLIRKYWNIPVSVTMYVFDFLIMLMQIPSAGVEKVLLGLLTVLCYTLTLDQMLLMGSARTEVKIISEHDAQIREAILSQLDRGVTMMQGYGGYEKKPLEMVLTVISNRELPRLMEIIRRIDPDCFVIIGRVSEVHGRGFTESKFYRREK